jgi:L-rhamnose mutarotase
MDALPNHPVMQHGWAHTVDIMQTIPDNAPVAPPPTPVFM